jgi:hypothetical protein
MLIALLALIVMACQSGTTTTTTATDPVEETSAPEETADPGSVSAIDDMPSQCVDALREYLRAIEPIVEGVDFQSLTQTDFEAMGEEIEAATAGFEEQTESCPELDLTTEESFALMREFAEEEAPGTVAYFTFIEEFAGSFDDVNVASGDCETDIAAFQEFVDRGGSMSDLTAEEVVAASSLMGSIGAVCSQERFEEWSQDEAIQEWISGG